MYPAGAVRSAVAGCRNVRAVHECLDLAALALDVKAVLDARVWSSGVMLVPGALHRLPISSRAGRFHGDARLPFGCQVTVLTRSAVR